MIDQDSIKSFWNARGRIQNMAPESLVNFEEDEARLRDKTELETKAVMPLMALGPDCDVLDLGAGTGQWTLRFAPFARHVCAVDYEKSFLDLAARHCVGTALDNVDFIQSPVEEFIPSGQFHRVFFSGVLMYLNDEAVNNTLANIRSYMHASGRVVLREPASILGSRHEIDKKYSQALKCDYSAIYRTPAEFKSIMAKAGLRCLQDGQIFPEGSIHNKFPETRLWSYVFVPEG